MLKLHEYATPTRDPEARKNPRRKAGCREIFADGEPGRDAKETRPKEPTIIREGGYTYFAGV